MKLNFFYTLLTYLPYFFVRTTFVKTKIFLLMSLEFEWFYNCAVGIMNKCFYHAIVGSNPGGIIFRFFFVLILLIHFLN